MRIRRFVTSVMSVGLLPALLVTVPSTAEAAGSIAVDDAPHGDTVVTVSADPGSAPYLRVLLALPSSLGPTASMPAIATDPVLNPGVPTDISVPTWGLGGGRSVWFTLVGCTSDDSSSCGTVLTTVQRTVTQADTDKPTTTVERPSGTLLLPQQRVTAQATNPGGGRMVATVGGVRGIVVGDQPTDVTDVLHNFVDAGGEGAVDRLLVRRCSSVQADLRFCEPDPSPTSVPFVRAARATMARFPHAMTMNDAWWTGRQRLTLHELHALDLPYDVSWELQDPTTHATVVGPVVALTGVTGTDHDVVLDPTRHVTSLADGSYDLVFSTTIHKDDLAATFESAPHTLSLVNDPPQDATPEVRSAQRIVRGPRAPAPHVDVDGYWDPEHSARLVVIDVDGKEVGHQSLANALVACTQGVACPTGYRFQFDVQPYGADGTWFAPGTYRLRLDAPDSFGRPLSTPLGNLYVQTTHVVERTVRVRPVDARVVGTRVVGRCSRERSPALSGVSGSVGLMSLTRCSSTAGTADLVRQDFRITVPARSNTNGGLVDVFRYGLAKGPRATALGAACQFPDTWVAGQVTRNEPSDGVCGRFIADLTRAQQVTLRLRVDHGARIDLDRLRAYVRYDEWYTPPS